VRARPRACTRADLYVYVFVCNHSHSIISQTSCETECMCLCACAYKPACMHAVGLVRSCIVLEVIRKHLDTRVFCNNAESRLWTNIPSLSTFRRPNAFQCSISTKTLNILSCSCARFFSCCEESVQHCLSKHTICFRGLLFGASSRL